MTETTSDINNTPSILLDEGDCSFTIHKNGNTSFAYNINEDSASEKAPVSFIFATGLALKLQDPEFIKEVIALGHDKLVQEGDSNA